MIAKIINEHAKTNYVTKNQIVKLMDRVKKTGSIYNEYEAKKKYRLQPKNLSKISRDKKGHENKNVSIKRRSLQTGNRATDI